MLRIFFNLSANQKIRGTQKKENVKKCNMLMQTFEMTAWKFQMIAFAIWSKYAYLLKSFTKKK